MESPFTQILNRTQQNLHRINQRYGGNPGAGTSLSSTRTGFLDKSSYQPALITDENNFANTLQPLNSASSANRVNNSRPNTHVNSDDQLLTSILNRLFVLEQAKADEESTVQRIN